MQVFYEQVDSKLNSKALHDAAYALLCRVLQTHFDVEHPSIVKTEQGKPYIENSSLKISLSHTNGLVCCAVAHDNEIGIDCERARKISEHVPGRVCTERELRDIWEAKDPDSRFLLYWTLKESISKKRGVGLRESFRQYEISWEGNTPVCNGYVLKTMRVGAYFISTAE